jgi:hypothetical protein
MLNSIKKIAREIITKEQKKVAYDLINRSLQPFSPSLSKKLILILGCQRSGTTLTFLILNTHPKIIGFDETQCNFDYPDAITLLKNSAKSFLLCYKLPTKTADLQYISKHFPQAKIIWPLRHPFAVISSMQSLILLKQRNWIDKCGKNELKKLAYLFPDILSLDLDKLDNISIGAHIWNYKNMLIQKFQDYGLDVFAFQYEDLLEKPEKTILQIVDFIGLDWSDNLINHHKYYQDHQKYAGGTKGNRPIDDSRKQPELILSNGEQELITSLCFNWEHPTF